MINDEQERLDGLNLVLLTNFNTLTTTSSKLLLKKGVLWPTRRLVIGQMVRLVVELHILKQIW